jgi:outer membrane beta-barrel protein
MMRKLAMIALLLFLSPSVEALAQEMSSAPMVRHRITWRTGRSELKPGLGWTFNDRYFHNVIVNIGYDYHLLDWLALGANVGYAFPIKTSFAEDIETQKKQDGLSFPIPATHLGLLADAHIELADGGKAMLWGRLAVAYDFHLILGLGVLQVNWNSEAENRLSNTEPGAGMKISPKVGAGIRIFLDKGVAITLDVIDHMAAMHQAAEVSADNLTYTFPTEEKLSHNFVGMLSFSIMMPSETTYED